MRRLFIFIFMLHSRLCCLQFVRRKTHSVMKTTTHKLCTGRDTTDAVRDLTLHDSISNENIGAKINENTISSSSFVNRQTGGRQEMNYGPALLYHGINSFADKYAFWNAGNCHHFRWIIHHHTHSIAHTHTHTRPHCCIGPFFSA